MRARSAAVVLALTGWPGVLATAQILPLSPEVGVNTYTTEHQRDPAVASDADGNFVVVWRSFGQDGNNDGVYGRRFDASGAPRGPEFRVNAYTTGNQWLPSVASDPAGNFVVAWTGVIHPVSGSDIFVQRYDSSGAPLGVNTVVNTYTTGAQQSSVVSMDDLGRFVVAWTSEDGDQSGVWFRAFNAVGTPLSSAIRANVYTTDFQAFPAIAQNGSADFVVTWQSAAEDGDGLGVYAVLFPAGQSSVGPFRANSYTTGNQQRPSVAVAPSGEFLVAWHSDGQDGSSYGVFAQAFDASGVRVGQERLVNTFTSVTQWMPALSADDHGRFIAVWEDNQEPPVTGIYGRRLDVAGAPMDPEFHVNTYTTNRQAFPAVSASPSGTFVVAWESDGQDGNGYGIFARRLGPDLIFADGFESGDTSRWSLTASDSGDLVVTGPAALDGTAFGLQGLVDDTAGIFVLDESPQNEGRYRARFYFDPNDFDPGEALLRFRTRILLVFEDAPARRLAGIVLRRIGGNYSLMGRARLDDNSQTNTPFFPIANGPHFVEIDWQRSSGPSADDGRFELFIDGASMSVLTGLDNSISSVDSVRLGALSVKAGASGTVYWDEFESRRLNGIGP